MERLTDLEGAALAEIAKRGPSTSYVVAQAFAASPSEYWSGSAGAVYPMIKRLAVRGLLAADEGSTGKRQRIDYSVTEDGRLALEGWLLDTDRASGLGFDPLRTRLVHLDLVSPERQSAFLADVRAKSAALATRPAFEGVPLSRQVHHTWMKARAKWLSMLDFVVRQPDETA